MGKKEGVEKQLKGPEKAGEEELEEIAAEEEVKKEVAETDYKKLAEEYLGRMKYLAADFDNYKKNSAKEREKARGEGKEELAMALLTALDECSHAMKEVEKTNDGNLKGGIRMIYGNLLKALESQGLTEMGTEGKKFDPHLHEAVAFAEGGEGRILREESKGYYFGGKVLRHAKVVVGKNKR